MEEQRTARVGKEADTSPLVTKDGAPNLGEKEEV